jgi:hypothetical protein
VLFFTYPALGQETENLQYWPADSEEPDQPPGDETATESAEEPAAPVLDHVPPPTDTGAQPHAGEDSKQKNDSPEEDSERRWWVFNFDDTIAQWAMAGLALFATGISVWAVFLLRYTLRATRDAVDVAIGAERAWLTYEILVRDRILFPDVGEQRHAIRLGWKNTGRSPAVRVALGILWVWCRPDDPVPHFDAPEIGPEARTSIIAPGSTLNTAQIMFTDDELDRLNANQIALYVYSIAVYGTTDKPGMLRRTEMCFRLVVNGFTTANREDRFPNYGLRAVGPQNAAD